MIHLPLLFLFTPRNYFKYEQQENGYTFALVLVKDQDDLKMAVELGTVPQVVAMAA